MSSLSVTSGVPIASSSSSTAAAAKTAALAPTNPAKAIPKIVYEIMGFYQEAPAPAMPLVNLASDPDVENALILIFVDNIMLVTTEQMEQTRVAIAEEVIRPFTQNPQNLPEVFNRVKVLQFFPYACDATTSAIVEKFKQLGERKAAVLRVAVDSLFETIQSVIPVPISNIDKTRITAILTITHCERVEQLAARLEAISPKIINVFVAKYQPAFDAALAAAKAREAQAARLQAAAAAPATSTAPAETTAKK